MYTIEEKLKAVNLVRQGMSYRQASKISGASYNTIWTWHKALNGTTSDLYALIEQKKRKDFVVDLENLPDDPDELKKIIFDMQFEMDLKEAVVDILKKDPGVDPKRLLNKEKALLVDALAKKRTYSIGWILSYVKLAPATFYYHKKRMGKDSEQKLKAKVIKVCAEHPEFGYRRIKHLLDDEGGMFACSSEKRIRRIMKAEGIQPSRRRKNSRYSSYDARLDNGEKLPNVPLREDGTHNFSTSAPNVLWLTDVTEFALPNEDRVFLSPIFDCYDSSLLSWKISVSEKAEELTNPSLEKAVALLSEGDTCSLHTDKGGHYFSEGWISICADHNITRSMSRKGHSPDNSRMEGFFGRLKMEFFDTRNWKGVSTDRFIDELDKWLVYYNEKRAKQSLGWLSPMQYRRLYFDAA